MCYVVYSIQMTPPEPYFAQRRAHETQRRATAEPKRLRRQLREEPVLLTRPAVVEAARRAALLCQAPRRILKAQDAPRSRLLFTPVHALLIRTRCAGIDACCVVSTRCRSTSMTGFRAPSGAKWRHASSRARFPRGRRFRTSCNADGHDQRERPMECRCGHFFSVFLVRFSPAFLYSFRVSLPHTLFFAEIPLLHPLDTTLCPHVRRLVESSATAETRECECDSAASSLHSTTAQRTTTAAARR